MILTPVQMGCFMMLGNAVRLVELMQRHYPIEDDQAAEAGQGAEAGKAAENDVAAAKPKKPDPPHPHYD
jgi:hypothetical protein